MRKLFLWLLVVFCGTLFAAEAKKQEAKQNFVKAGFYECDITPPYGADCPGDRGKRIIRKISDPLKVRAMALTDGKIKIALVGIDNISPGAKFLKRLQEAMPGIYILNSSSHTHYGGNLRDKVDVSKADPIVQRLYIDESVYHDAIYYEYCLRQTITAIKVAFENLQEVEFSFGKGKVENLIFNRRTRMKDGSVKTHAGKGNPNSVGYAGPVDDELGVMGVWKKGSDELLGFALNFSCHACINLEGATSDFCGVAIDTVRRVYGRNAGAVYINGASGDVTQIDNMSLKKDVGKPIAIKLGRAVGGEAVKILAAADRGQITALNYIAEKYIAQRKAVGKINPEAVKKAYEIVRKNADKKSSEYQRAKRLVKGAWSRSQNPNPKPYEMQLAAVQIGPLVIGSTPGEMFAQFAFDFKKASKHHFSWFSQLSHALCYIPTADAFDKKTGGGYELSSAMFVPKTGHEMTDVLIRLVNKFEKAPIPPPETVPPVHTVWDYNN